MSPTAAEAPVYLQLRGPLTVLFYAIGLWSPWTQRGGSGSSSLLWLSLPQALASGNLASPEKETHIVTIAVTVLLAAGAAMRIWGAARRLRVSEAGAGNEESVEVVSAKTASARLLSSLGALVFAAGAAVLMPATGAAVFLIELLLLHILWWVLERRHDREGGYAVARPARLSWLLAAAKESFFWSFAICFALFASRYNAQILFRCLLICFGASLVLRAAAGGGTTAQ